MERSGELKRQALGGAFWSVARFGSEQVFRFVVFAFLARLLSPTDFGIFALASIFVDVGRILGSAGISESMIRAEKADDELSDTLFWLAVGRGLAVAGVLIGLAVPMANLLSQPAVAPVIMALGACLLFEPLSQVHSALATRAFKNKGLTGIALFCNFTSGASAVVAAYFGLGLWAFVISQLVYGILATVLTWFLFPWMPSFRGFSWARLKEVAKFSNNMVLAQLLYVCIARSQDFVTGRFLGPSALGHLRVAGRVFDVITKALIMPMAAIALPTLSRLQDNDERFRNAFSRMAALSCLVACPASLGFAAVASDALPLLFGNQWVEAIPVVQILGLAIPAGVLSAFASPTLAALGRSDTMVRFALLQLVAVTLISVWAVRYGIVVLSAANVARAYLVLPVQLWLFTRATGMSGWAVMRNVIPPAGASMAMAAVLLLITPYMQGAIASPILRLLVMVPLGALLYGGVLLVVWRRFLFDQIEGVRSALAARGGAEA